MPRPIRRGRLRVVRGAPAEGSPPSSAGMVPWAAAASVVLPGLGQFLQGRRRAATGHLLGGAGVYAVTTLRGWPSSLQIGALLAFTLWSAADAARAERLARRAPLRLV